MKLIKILNSFLKENTENIIVSSFSEKYNSECNYCSDEIDYKKILPQELYYVYLKELEENDDEYRLIANKMRKEFNDGVLFEYDIKNCHFRVIDSYHFLFHLLHWNGKVKRVLKLKVNLEQIFILISKGLEKIFFLSEEEKEKIAGNYILVLKKFFNNFIRIPIDVKLQKKVEIKKIILKKNVLSKNINENNTYNENNKKYKYYFDVIIPTVLLGYYQEKNIRNEKNIIIEKKQNIKKYKKIII